MSLIQEGRLILAALVLGGCAGTSEISIGTPDPRVTDRNLPICLVSDGIPGQFCLTEFQVESTQNPNELAIQVCTTGRPVNSTIRVRVSRLPVVEINQQVILGDSDYDVIKELGVPCFDTNQSAPDHPIWNTSNLIGGNYVIEAQTRPDEAKGNWNDKSVITYYSQYQLEK